MLECPDEGPQENATVCELHDRVANQLAGAVVRDLATALDADDLDPAPVELIRSGKDVARIGLPAERQHGLVLEEQELVGYLVSTPEIAQLIESVRLPQNMTAFGITAACRAFEDQAGLRDRVATIIANILRGKHKASFTPHVDCGDHVVVVNADKVRFTGPVRSGSMVSGRFTLAKAEDVRPGDLRCTWDVEVRIDGAERPAVVAQWLIQVTH